MVVLIVAVMFILLIAFSYWREIVAKKKAVTAKAFSAAIEKTQAEAANYFLHPSHTFAKLAENGLAVIGMDEFAKRAFGKVELAELPKAGQQLRQGDVAWKAQVGSRSLTQRMPVDGTIQEVNPEAGQMNGWILKVTPIRLKENLANLIQGSAVANWLKSARTKFLLDYSGHLVPAMQDGGELVEGFARHLTDEQWKEFCKEFFNSETC
jgi:glycine cleavage system H lipoate-binding protein